MLHWKRSSAIGALAVVISWSAALAQTETPTVAPLPYSAYYAALEDAGVAAGAPFESLGATSTVADLVAAFGDSIAVARTDQERLSGVVPEPCYEAAHREVLAYQESVLELFDVTLPLMAESPSLDDVVGLIEGMDAELYARHPLAYVDEPTVAQGFGGSTRHVLSALATCDADAGAQPSMPPSPSRPILAGAPSPSIPPG